MLGPQATRLTARQPTALILGWGALDKGKDEASDGGASDFIIPVGIL